MPDASSTTAGAGWMAGVTAATLAVLGVDYYALVGALFGVLFALSGMPPTGNRLRVFCTVAIATCAAGAVGQGIAHLAELQARPVVLLISLVSGVAGQPLLQAFANALVAGVQGLAARFLGGR